MSRETSFACIENVLVVQWRLQTATPLCIRTGSSSTFRQSKRPKTRNIDAYFDFFTKEDFGKDDSQVADFAFSAAFQGDQLSVRYHIPATSLRGALRNHTIRKLVPREWWGLELAAGAPRGDNSGPTEAGGRFLKALQEDPGWHLIQNLFGIAADGSSTGLAKQAVAGRIQVSIDELSEAANFAEGLLNGNFSRCRAGSAHGTMRITPRSPLCRIVQCAKQGGLHTFMVLDKGTCIGATLRIINPEPPDLGLVGYWEQEIADGHLSLGGLSAVGRGRLELETTHIHLYTRSIEGFDGRWEEPACAGADPLADLFPAKRLTDWSQQKPAYLEKLKTKFAKKPRRSKEETNG